MKILNAILKNPLAALLLLLLLLMGGCAGTLKWDLHKASKAFTEATTERDSLALEGAASRAEDAGWKVTMGDSVGNLRKRLAKQDTAMATLVEDLHASRARLSWMADVNVTLRGQVESFGSPMDPPDSAPESPEPSEWSGELSDGLLTASWAFRAVDVRLLLDPYAVQVEGELVGSEGGDGSHVVFARAFDPRATLSLGNYTFQPAPPVIETRCTGTRTGVIGGIGFLAGVWTGARAGG